MTSDVEDRCTAATRAPGTAAPDGSITRPMTCGYAIAIAKKDTNTHFITHLASSKLWRTCRAHVPNPGGYRLDPSAGLRTRRRGGCPLILITAASQPRGGQCLVAAFVPAYRCGAVPDLN